MVTETRGDFGYVSLLTQSAQMYIDRDFALLTAATWSCRAPTLTESVGAVILCSGRTDGTSCHLTFAKCPINQNNLLEH